jgi:hypothetical protein
MQEKFEIRANLYNEFRLGLLGLMEVQVNA